MNEQRIAAGFMGLNRRTAPHLLSEQESPSTKDAAHALDVIGELGPRPGRRKVYNRSSNINGVIPMNVPGERFRIICTRDGIWRPENIAWPNTSSISVNGGFDTITISALTVARVGVGTQNGTSKILSSALNLANYNKISLDLGTYGDGMVHTEAGGFTTGTIKLQGQISTVWTDLWTWQLDAAGLTEAQNLQAATTGSLTDLRLVSTVTVSGDLSATLNGKLVLELGALRTAVTIS